VSLADLLANTEALQWFMELIAGIVARHHSARTVPAPHLQPPSVGATPDRRQAWSNWRPQQQLATATALFVLAGTLVFDAWWVIGLVSRTPRSVDPAQYIFDADGRAHPNGGHRGEALSAGTRPPAARLPSAPSAVPLRPRNGKNLAPPQAPVRHAPTEPASARSGAPHAPPRSPSGEVEINRFEERRPRVVGSSAASEPGPTDDVVYDSSSVDVTPPIELPPYVARRSPHRNSSSETATFELVINEAGRVQSVRLVQPLKRWDDVMVLSAIKARRFQPATRNNHPVKYRTRIVVGPPETP
jgi:hypothetical protein